MSAVITNSDTESRRRRAMPAAPRGIAGFVIRIVGITAAVAACACGFQLTLRNNQPPQVTDTVLHGSGEDIAASTSREVRAAPSHRPLILELHVDGPMRAHPSGRWHRALRTIAGAPHPVAVYVSGLRPGQPAYVLDLAAVADLGAISPAALRSGGPATARAFSDGTRVLSSAAPLRDALGGRKGGPATSASVSSWLVLLLAAAASALMMALGAVSLRLALAGALVIGAGVAIAADASVGMLVAAGLAAVALAVRRERPQPYVVAPAAVGLALVGAWVADVTFAIAFGALAAGIAGGGYAEHLASGRRRVLPNRSARVRFLAPVRVEVREEDDRAEAPRAVTPPERPNITLDRPSPSGTRRKRDDRWDPPVVGRPSAAAGAQPALAPHPGMHDTVVDFAKAGDMDIRAASVRGASHRAAGVVRQDAYVLDMSADGRFAIVAVADGVSGAAMSHVGARWASLHATRAVKDQLAQVGFDSLDARRLCTDVAFDTLCSARAELPDEWSAGGPDQLAEAVATTLVVAVVELDAGSERRMWCARVGDSGAQILRDTSWQQVWRSAPTSDSNATEALPGQPNAVESISLEWCAGDAIVLMTDGVEKPLGGGEGEVGDFLARSWQEPPPPAEFLVQLQFERKTFDDDRTAVALWPLSVGVERRRFRHGGNRERSGSATAGIASAA